MSIIKPDFTLTRIPDNILQCCTQYALLMVIFIHKNIWFMNVNYNLYTEALTKWPPFCWSHFQMKFLPWKYDISTRFVPENKFIDSVDYFPSNGCTSITWTSDDNFYYSIWCYQATMICNDSGMHLPPRPIAPIRYICQEKYLPICADIPSNYCTG